MGCGLSRRGVAAKRHLFYRCAEIWMGEMQKCSYFLRNEQILVQVAEIDADKQLIIL